MGKGDSYQISWLTTCTGVQRNATWVSCMSWYDEISHASAGTSVNTVVAICLSLRCSPFTFTVTPPPSLM